MDASGVMVVGVLVALVVVAVAWQVVRRPVQRRLAVRDAIRRPSETALVIAGSLLGTALITGSFIVGDTLDSSIRATARTQLGPVDELVEVRDPRSAADIERELDAVEGVPIDGVMSLVAVPASLVAQGEDTRAEPDAQLIEADFDEARSFGGDPEATGVEGETPGAGRVAVTDDLAESLGVTTGDRISGYLFGAELDLEVDRVLPRLGIAGFWRGETSRSFNAFVAPGTIADLTQGGVPPGATPPSTTVLVSNRGGVEDGVDLTDEVTAAIEDVVGAGVRVERIKEERLESAEAQGDEFSELFLGIGAFAIVAGVLLLVNIFVMLAEERKSQLGMLRAIGMRRSDLIRAFVIEGFIYSVTAGAVGAIAGIGVGWAIAKLAAPIFGGVEEFALELTFSMTPESILSGFFLGILISMLTIFVTSFRISRVNIIRAIRELPEPRLRRTRKRTVVLGSLLAALSAAWFVSSLASEDQWLPAIVGPPLIAFGVLPLTSRLFGRRVAVVMASGFSLFWGIFGDALLSNRFFTGEIFSFVIQGLLLTLSAVVLLSQTHDLFEVLVRRVAAGNLPVRLGLAYPMARLFRTGLTLGMYALVIFTMTFIAVLSAVFGGQVDTVTKSAAGGFDIVVTASTSNPPAPETLRQTPGVETVSTLLSGYALWLPDALDEPQPWPATGIEADFVDVGAPELEDRAPGFDSDEAAWRRVVSDPGSIMIPEFFLQTGGGPPAEIAAPGDTIVVLDPITGERAERNIVGVVSQDIAFSGVYMSQGSLRSLLGPSASPSRFFVATEPGADAHVVAEELQGELFRNGVEADTFRSIVEEFQSLNLQFFDLMQGYLALGLLVGIAGLGVVMVRSVRERRREIGVLRSLGFVSPQIRRAFLLEAGFTALQGIVIGSVLAIITAAQLVASEEFGETAVFTIPWDQLVILSVGALVASLVATAWPARQAAHIPPAVALRIAD